MFCYEMMTTLHTTYKIEIRNITQQFTENMKTLSLLTLFLVSSCSLIELEQPVNGELNSTGSVVGPNSLPGSTEVTSGMLSGESGKSWKAEAFTIMGFSGMLQCRIDDRIMINSDGTFDFDGGEILCGAEDNMKLREGLWSVGETGTEINFTLGNDVFQADIQGFVEDSLLLTGSYAGLEIQGLYVHDKGTK